jgi:hypothetical protein
MENEDASDDATIESNLELVTFIQLTRLYDVGMAILQELNEDKATILHDMHTVGDFLSSPPALADAPEE